MSDEKNSILLEDGSPPKSNPYIDKITLELLLNKSAYQKYLSKTDPEKHNEYQEFIKKTKRFRSNILEITENLIDHEKHQYTNEVTDAFGAYMHALIKYLEIELSNQQNGDEDVLFPPENIKYNFR
jgi:F0F1-type ATP synthase membrane subunit b/b'